MNKIKILFDWFIKGLNKIISRKFKNLIFKFSIIKLTFFSFFYNDHLSQTYAIDTLLEPLFWFVDNFTKTLGPIFVSIVVSLLLIFVFIAYLIGLSFWLLKNLKITILALIIGNYLLINALFHYFMAWKTNPGELPSNVLIKNSVSICKKCILPKPSRAHHCSICDKCILKMDHHCPWLNNCIGNFNHRYFFSFCLFVWLGTIFIMIFGVPVALNHYFNIDIFTEDFRFYFLVDYNFYKNLSNQTDIKILELDKKIDSYFNLVNINYFTFKSNCIIFEILATISVFFGIGGLMFWHAKLITKGETCIESHINKKEKIRLEFKKKKFSNPFDKGWKKNWERFFGIDQTNVNIWNIIFPSTHLPSSNGIEWDIFD